MVFGLGGSNAVALIAYHKFLRMPLQTVYHQDFHYQQMLASKLTEKTVLLLFHILVKQRYTENR